MSKLDEVLKALNRMLGNSAVQRASELVKSVEVVLHEDENKGEQIPPPTDKPRPTPKQPVKGQVTFFEGDNHTAGAYVPPKPSGPSTAHRPSYPPINVRKQQEPLYRIHYQKLRQIGVLEKPGDAFCIASASIFYEQALYVQGISDDYVQDEAFSGHYVSFMELSVRQFRRYVTLHPQLLRGDYSNITAATGGYLLLYASELICGAAHPEYSPNEVLSELEVIREYLLSLTYENEYEHEVVNERCSAWLFDYALSHQMKEEMQKYAQQSEVQSYRRDLLKNAVAAYHKKDAPALLAALSAACPYHICTTAVCKKEPYDRVYPQLFLAVLAALEQHFHSGKPMEQRLFGRKYRSPYRAFQGTVAQTKRVPSFSMVFEPWVSYQYDDQTGLYEMESYWEMNTDWIAAVLRCMDYCFRLEVGSVKLKSSGMSSAAQEKAITKAVHEFCVQHKLVGFETRRKQRAKQQKKKQQSGEVQQPVKVEIDYSKLAGIRKDAGEVEARLLSVYEDPDQQEQPQQVIAPVLPPVTVTEPPAEKPKEMSETQTFDGNVDAEWVDFAQALNEQQTAYLKLLVKDRTEAQGYLDTLHRQTGILPQLFLEQIDALALESLGDTILDPDGEAGIFEDYIEAAKAVFSDHE